MRLKIPKSLKQYEKKVLATERDSLQIQYHNEKVDLTQSKIGGQPYWLKGEAYPTTASGQPLRFLAQVNFSEIEQGLEDYPGSGLLQFFILDDDLHGLNFDDQTKQDSFRVVYHEIIETDSSKWEKELPTFDQEKFFPVEKELAMTFKPQKELISLYDYRFNQMTNLESLLDNGQYDEYDEITESYGELTTYSSGSKLNGYPFFTQDDPRYQEQYQSYDSLLFQIDSYDTTGIMWGDGGVANFFISRENLKSQNFADVLYNWDCY
ncbi:MAG TPA: YwqG family protein [Pseudogracilibacillus sp.]|nr:YwqG family protein [Pseudogracilibacillus sp.]